MTSLTPSQIRRADRLRFYGYRIAAIARALECKAEDVDRALNWSVPPQGVVHKIVSKIGPTPVCMDRIVGDPEPPAPVVSLRNKHDAAALAARDKLFAAPRTLTESLCGDPLPGRSALDKQRMNLAAKPLPGTDIKAGLSAICHRTNLVPEGEG